MEETEDIYPNDSESCQYSDLSVFEGMVGFEDFDPMDDSTVTTIFDDLHEGTLLSILNDDLFNDLVTDQMEYCVVEQSGKGEKGKSSEVTIDELFNEMDQSRTCNSSFKYYTENSPITAFSKVKHCEEHMLPSYGRESMQNQLTVSEGVCECTFDQTSQKGVKFASLCENEACKEQRLTPTIDTQYLLECVQHDHCYIGGNNGGKRKGTAERRGSSMSEQSTSSDSVEEGSNSDGGYDTMSATTSPGTTSSGEGTRSMSPPPHVTLPTLSHLGEHIDPVALIDARIKHFMCSREVNLTEEEKETLKAEGLPIPTTLPLTKAEEKALRNVRRKIRNKVAAQESRKRKKEHLLTLEERVKEYSSENLKLKKRIETLESENKLLLTQLKVLTSSGGARRSTHLGACVMVIALCFAVIIGGFTPKELWNSQQSDYATSSVRSRSLLSLEHQNNFQNMACDWFRHIFVPRSEDSGSNHFSNSVIHVGTYHGNTHKKTDHLSSSMSTLNDEPINISGYSCEHR